MAVLQDININVHGQPSEKRLQTFLRLSQNENGRMINFRVLGPPLPSGCTATFAGTKPDGNVYSTTGTVTGNFVVVQEDIQMTAVAGVWDAKLDIVNGVHNIMSALIRVTVERDVVDPDAIASDSQLQGLVAEAKYYAEHARTDAYGSPLTAPTKAQMTDHTRVYVYTGSEPNMVAGNWYHWNGTAWISGGVYNSVAVQSDSELNDFSTNPVQNKVIKAALDQIEGAIPEIDATLSTAGKAADAKKTGDEIASLKEDLNGKVDISQGVAHAGEALIIGEDGNVTTGEAGVSVDTTLSIAGKAADAKATGDAINAVGATVGGFDGRLQELSDTLYEYTAVPVDQTRNNYCLQDTGFYTVTTAYKTMMYPVVAGQVLKVVSPYKWQYQTANTAVTSGDPVRVGDTTYGDGTFNVTVPTGATFIAVSVLKADTPTVSVISNEFEAQTERLLGDEEIVLLLESAKDDIRKINLNADFFQSGYSSRRTSFKVFNPTTKKGLFPTTPSATVYDNIDIGLRTLYLTKGDKVITNIDAVYDNSKLHIPNQTFANSGYYGVILSTFINNTDTDNGSVYFGREAFDGKWRVLDIEVTVYYELSFRQYVSYTNKAYIWHQHKTLVDHNDIIADITDGLSFKDGCVRYNAVTGWDGAPVDNIGSSGGYQNKTVLLSDLTDYIGKSVIISGLSIKQPEPTAAVQGEPAIIYYQNDAPTTYYLSFYRYIYNKDYACFPILDGYDMRIQFPATACLPFVRVWIVDNDTLFKNGLANPVFYGKTILGFGDSYIAGQGIATTWHRMVAYRNSGHWINHGYGGAGLCYGGNGSLLNHLSDLDEDADIYILCFGRNDNSTNIKIGENDDELDTSIEWTPGYLINTATFKGAMNYLFNYLETLHPYAKILTVTPWGFVNNDNVTSGLSCLDYIDAMQEMSKKWGITCFNAAGDAGIHVRIEAYRTRYFLAYNDQSHLNGDGHALMAKRATKLLTNLLYDD